MVRSCGVQPGPLATIGTSSFCAAATPARDAACGGAALTKACENKDLTRKGVLDALHSLTALDTGGTIAGTLDFSDPATPPGSLVYIAKVSKDAPGGLEALGEPSQSPDVEGYSF